jgi:hypothetical protein
MTPVQRGASAAQQLSKYLRAHATTENELLGDYQALCEELPAPSMRYLARLILADEQRHQMIFGDLAETVFATDDLKASGMPILQGVHVTDEVVRQRTLDTLERLIAWEGKERLELMALRGSLAPDEESGLWNLLLGLAAQDTERHISWLEFMRDQML